MLPQAVWSSFPDIMARMIFKSLVGSRKAGSLGFSALGCGSLRDSSGPGDRVYAALVLVGAGFKPAQARAVSALCCLIPRNTLPGVRWGYAYNAPTGAAKLKLVDLLPSALLIPETLLPFRQPCPFFLRKSHNTALFWPASGWRGLLPSRRKLFVVC